MCISVSQLVRNIGIAIYDGLAVFVRLRRLNVIIWWWAKWTLNGEEEGKLRIATLPYVVFVFVCVCVSYVHNLDSARKILQTRLEKKNNKKIKVKKIKI